MKRLAYLTTIGIILSVAGCSTSSDQSPNTISHQGTNDLTPRLDDGEKWVVNDATKEGIENMVSLVNSFELSDNLADYLKLNEQLEQEFKTIFEKCDMNGEAHDQLHNYLFPLKRLFNKLKSEDLSESKGTVKELKVYLSTFPDYFK